MKSSIVNKRHIHLIETEEDYQLLKSLIENPSNKTIGYDTETTGLDYIHDHIVGFCFGVGSPIEGYYIPVRHVIGNNFPVEYGLDLIRYCLESKKTLLMCNKVFDITMTEKEGVYFPFNAKIMDVQIMAHLVTQEKFPSLKKSVSKYLKYKVVEFSEAAKNSEEEKNYNAGDTNPEQFYLYAAADPVYTVDLGRFLWKEYPYIRKIFPIDNIAAEAVRRISKNVIHLDYSVIRKELEHEEALLREDKLRCFQIAGYEFNPASNRQKGEALSRFVVLTKKTKSGKDFQVNDEILEGIDHPLAEALVSFSKRRKYISSYLTPLLATEGTPVRIHYGMVAAPTGRMASGTYRGNSFYAPLNVMSIPKVSKKRYIHPDPVLGYILNDNPEGAIGQQKTKAGLRDAFIAPEGYVVVTADFCLDPNVLVQTRTGLKEMRLLKDGEEVLTPKGFKKCINPHYTGNHQVYKLVTSYYELRCSGEHKVVVMMSDRYVWKEVKNLRPDELVFIINSNGEKEFTPFIVQKTDEVIEMMDMTVEDVHCFYANGILVHNCGEELRIVTNMSGERVFADAILNGKDLHMETAKTMFGVASEEQRDHVKTINFASLYGANEYTLSKKLKIPVESAKHMLDIYKKSLSALTRWKEWIVKQGKKTGFVFTYYGRPRTVYQYFKSSDRSMQGFAERTCYNSPIQGAVTVSQRVHTDHGYLTMREIVDMSNNIPLDGTTAHPSLKIWTGYSYQPFGLFDHRKGQTKRVTFSDGSSVDVNLNHIFKSISDEGIGDIHIHQLKVGDYIQQPYFEAVQFSEKPWTPLQYYLAGRYLGDGYYSNGIIRMTCSISEVPSLYSIIPEEWRSKTKYYLVNDNYDKDIVSSYPGTIIKVINKRGNSAEVPILAKYSSFLGEMGFKRSNAHSKRIPSSIFSSSLEQRANFIKGFFDSDGSKTQDQFSWHLCQYDLLKDLQLLLRTCGIRSKIKSSKSDSSYLLYVHDSDKFADLIHTERKSKTTRCYGRTQDYCITPKFMSLAFITWWDENGYGLMKSLNLSKEQQARNYGIIYKLRKNKPVGLSTFYHLSEQLGYVQDIKCYYSKVVSIEDVEEERALCPCLWDESHQYEANGILHHNCIPSSTFIPLDDSVVRLSSVLGQKCLFSDGKYGIVSGRGSSTILYDVFTKSGDFCRVDSNHKLITKSNGEYRTILVQDVYKKSICLSPLRWRMTNPLRFLTVKRPKKHILIQSQHTKVMRTSKLIASFWRCYLSHSKFRIEHKRALDVRALADLCGFNLKYKGSYYVLSLNRPKKSKVTTVIPRVENVPIASATMDGIQIYPAQGFLNKNTGADVMRILLTKLQNEVETNPEFRENVIIGWPVHDEVNSYVKLNYIHDYFYKIKEFMTIKHDNWIVPLEAEIGIGYSWGTCFDVTEVTKDNKLVLPDKYKTETK